MTPTVIAITVAYYLSTLLMSLVDLTGPAFDNTFYLIPMLIAGIIGGIQFAATNGHGLRWPKRLLCSFYGNIGIITAPILVWLFFFLPLSLIGFGFSSLMILPSIATLMTISWLLAFLVTFLLAPPTIFVGFTLGQWLQFRRMQR